MDEQQRWFPQEKPNSDPQNQKRERPLQETPNPFII
jgi:hypothetical protein